jgi:hypothetical protein
MFDYREILRAMVHHNFNDFSSDGDARQSGGVLNNSGLHISRRILISNCAVWEPVLPGHVELR